jgi:hypothetical protein
MILLRKRSKPPRLSQPPPTAACDAHCRVEEELAQFRRNGKYVRNSTSAPDAVSPHLNLLLKGSEPLTWLENTPKCNFPAAQGIDNEWPTWGRRGQFVSGRSVNRSRASYVQSNNSIVEKQRERYFPAMRLPNRVLAMRCRCSSIEYAPALSRGHRGRQAAPYHA